MNCFQLIKTVLDEIYAQIPGNDDQKDDAIRKALDDLSRQYAELLTMGCLDYSDPAKRFAYIYKYTTTHADIICSFLTSCSTAGDFFRRSKVTMSAIGGGPGSDFLGALKFCESQALTPTLRCILLDRDAAWGESWQDVDEKISGALQIKTVFQTFDVTDPASYIAYQKHFASDVFSLIYFMSEVFASKAKAKDYFRTLFDKAKSGSLFIFVDNNDSRFFDWFDKLATKYGLQIVEKAEGTYQLTPSEEKRDLGKYFDKFTSPKLTANIAYRIAIKK